MIIYFNDKNVKFFGIDFELKEKYLDDLSILNKKEVKRNDNIIIMVFLNEGNHYGTIYNREQRRIVSLKEIMLFDDCEGYTEN